MKQTIISSEYIHSVKAIKQAILENRYRAARHVNKEVLALYYWVGNYVSVHSRIDAWNTNAIATISKMLLKCRAYASSRDYKKNRNSSN